MLKTEEAKMGIGRMFMIWIFLLVAVPVFAQFPLGVHFLKISVKIEF